MLRLLNLDRQLPGYPGRCQVASVCISSIIGEHEHQTGIGILYALLPLGQEDSLLILIGFISVVFWLVSLLLLTRLLLCRSLVILADGVVLLHRFTEFEVLCLVLVGRLLVLSL